MFRSVKIAAMEISVGDMVAVAAAGDVEEDAESPLALLQALWQTVKGQRTLACYPSRPLSIFSKTKTDHSHVCKQDCP